tara:strand:+ start:2047 stop:2427 length:381 start_codon:yes stop_codon:yes gene_type:complete
MTKRTETVPTTDIREIAEDLILKAVSNPKFQQCHTTVQRMITRLENSGFKNRTTPMTQVEKLMNHMRKIGPISQREAYLEYDIQSFHRRLSDIRAMGYELKTIPKVNPVTGQEYTRYALVTLEGVN